MRIVTLAAAAALLLMSTSNAYAYLDPGTGSILLQGLIGAIAGGLFFAKMYWAKFKTMLGFEAPETTLDDDDNTSDTSL